MANLLIYNSAGTGTQILGANIMRYRYPDIEVMDINGVVTATIQSDIAALVDDTYDNVFICATSQTAPATGVLSFDQVALLDTKLVPASKATVLEADTCQANAVVTNIILAATANPNDDYYNGLNIRTAGVTAVSRYITDYTGLTTKAVVLTTTEAVTGTETYEIFARSSHVSLLGNTSPSGKTTAYNAWTSCYPDVTIPLVVKYVGGYQFAQCSGTAAATAAGTITLAANVSVGDIATDLQHDTNDFYNGMYVYIYTATTGATQWRQITDYDGGTHVATLNENWTVSPEMIAGGTTAPSGTVLYRVVDNDKIVGYDRATDIAIRSSLWDISSTTAIATMRRLIDNNGGLVGNPNVTAQDIDYLWYEFIVAGKSAAVADAYGIV